MHYVCLGPKGTFSELAVLKHDPNAKLAYESSIEKVFKTLTKNQIIGVVPIENTLDGFVQETLDYLLKYDVRISKEIIIPVQFDFVYHKEVKDIKEIYVQFKSKGQCLDFLSTLATDKIILTDSNTEALYLMRQNPHSAAIIPSHLKTNYPKITNVSDSKENQTRFVLIEKANDNLKPSSFHTISLYVLSNDDKPGLLFNILKVFANYDINLKSIMSRPNKTHLGTYHFYFELNMQNTNYNQFEKSLFKLNQSYHYKMIGLY